MRIKMTPTTHRLLDELNRLSVEIEPRLDLVSDAARDEWRELQSRLPTAQDLGAGLTSVPDGELAVILAKVLRFREILGLRRSHARLGPKLMRLVPLERS